MQRPAIGPPVFLFVVDTGMVEKELEMLKSSLLMTLNMIPQNCSVGLITFGTMACCSRSLRLQSQIQVHELSSADFAKCHVFRGNRDMTAQQVQDFLGLIGKGGRGSVQSGVARFVQPLGECDYTLTKIIEDLQHDPWPVKPELRPQRCTGSALSIAMGMTEIAFPNYPVRIMMFLGGPCTAGPGQVVDIEKTSSMRSHRDIEKNEAPHYQKAKKVVVVVVRSDPEALHDGRQPSRHEWSRHRHLRVCARSMRRVGDVRPLRANRRRAHPL